MNRAELFFERPAALQATAPPEARGLARDSVRLLVSTAEGHTHERFLHLARFLNAGDLLVVNDSATLPASLPACGAPGEFIVNLSTDYGGGVWLAEPRRDHATPGPLPLRAGEAVEIAGLPARLLVLFPGQPRLWFVHVAEGLRARMNEVGRPIRYGYAAQEWPLARYQTIFARVPGSAEMPSAGRPFSRRVLRALAARGVAVAPLTLHTGVSSLEVEADEIEAHALYPEPFAVPADTARAVNEARRRGGRVIAVGTTVVRALESAWDGGKVVPARGFTRHYVHPAQGVRAVEGLITGFHDPYASHLAMLYAVAGQALVRDAYAEAVAHGYLWHEFGDSHLILPER